MTAAWIPGSWPPAGRQAEGSARSRGAQGALPAKSVLAGAAVAATSLQALRSLVCPWCNPHLCEALGAKHHQRHNADKERLRGAHAEEGRTHRLRRSGAAPTAGRQLGHACRRDMPGGRIGKATTAAPGRAATEVTQRAVLAATTNTTAAGVPSQPWGAVRRLLSSPKVLLS